MTPFERATKQKLRFDTAVGLVSVEDLWDLPLEQLDKLAQTLHKEVESGEEVSFIEAKKPTAAFTELKLKFDVVKCIIEVRMAAKKKLEKAAATKARKAKILEIMEKKQDETLEGKSLEELQALLEGDDEEAAGGSDE
jgi:hypothetical protein